MTRTNSARGAVASALLLLLLARPASAQVSASDATIHVGASAIGGVVTSAKGPEAGVWVIAETNDLPTKYAKIVVTDDAGRYLLPDLPPATYEIWVRGYGLADSKRIRAKPGERLNLAASIAADAHQAAQIYPAIYWYSMLKIPDESLFSGPTRDPNMPD
ncbi:MAG: carboxypeptidase-like regulatory domain-containing protein, partial [Acetobacteraceae bacterium]